MVGNENFAYINMQQVKNVICYPVQFGWHKYSTKGNLQSVVRQHNILHIVLAGKGIYKVGNKTYTITKNTGFLIRPSEIVYYYSDPEDFLEYVWIGFEGQDIQYVLDYIGLGDKEEYIIKLKDTNRIKSLIKRMIIKNNERNNILQSGYLNLVIEEIHLNLIGRRYFSDEKNYLLAKALKHIANNLKTITITELASYLNLERTGLYKLFIRELSISPQQYLLKCRLEKARDWIVETNIDLKEVCNNSGFGNYAHFSRIFAKYYLMPPSQYRKSSIEERLMNTNEEKATLKF